VIENLQTQDHALLDARAEVRFRGEQEPIDPVAGHIPNAACLPSTDNLTETGLFKSPQALRQRFVHLDPEKTVCYCGSGVTATHNVLAMKVAGLAEPALYADSWSGWITDRTRPVGR
jgi:thiosulfate/3-mercaptopyruvate sulfurtransferase